MPLVPLPGIWHNGRRSPVKEPALKPLFTLFWQLCRFRCGPEDLPYSPARLLVVLLLELSLGLLAIPLLAQLDTAESPPAVAPQLLALLFGLGTWMLAMNLLLRFKNLSARFVQTMTAALGADLILTLPQILLFLLILPQPPESPLAAVGRMGLLALYLWDLLVKGHIYSRALNLGRLQGNLLSLALAFGIFMASSLLFSPSPP